MAGGAPKGNTNSARGRRWTDAINKALDKRSKAAGIEALDNLAEKLLALCDEGDLQALKELGDRLEGKSLQSVNMDATVDASLTVEIVRYGD
jgi:hypothetical protein